MTGMGGKRAVTPEMEVLLWAVSVDRHADEHISMLLRSGVDWERLMRLVNSHNLSAFLYHRIHSLPSVELKKMADSYFKDIYWANIRRNLHYSRQLLWILQTLSEHGIKAVPFKGVVLAVQAYGTSDLRQSVDIDLLIQKEQLSAVTSVLTGLGFESEVPLSSSLTSSFTRIIMRKDKFHARERISIDVHWKISDVFSGHPIGEDFYHPEDSVELLGKEIATFSLENTLVMLSAHGMKHFWREMKSVCDIIHLIHTHPELDLRLALKKAKDFHCFYLLCTALMLAESLGGLQFEKDIITTLDANPRCARIANYILKYVKSGDNPDLLFQIYIMTLTREHWIDAIGFALYGILQYNPREGGRFRIPRPLRPVHLIFYPFTHIFSTRSERV